MERTYRDLLRERAERFGVSEEEAEVEGDSGFWRRLGLIESEGTGLERTGSEWTGFQGIRTESNGGEGIEPEGIGRDRK